MIDKLRRKFILIASFAILIALAIVLLCVNGANYISQYTEIRHITDYIMDNSGRLPTIDEHRDDIGFHVTDELEYELRYFSQIVDTDGNVVGTNYEHIASVSDDEADLLAQSALGRHSDSGFITVSGNKYSFMRRTLTGDELEKVSRSFRLYTDTLPEECSLVVYLDCTRRFYSMIVLRNFTIFIGLVSMLVFFFIISAFSKRAVKPYIDNHERQKQFITNAGHELKTPLTIISANMEVLEMMDGANEWTESTMNQVSRLSGLVNDLITIARAEEGTAENVTLDEDVNATAEVRELADSFRTVAEQQGSKLTADIEENVTLKGGKRQLHELFSILIDNAVKYCDDGGTVDISLQRVKKNVRFTVSNDYKDGENVDTSRFFERFYREDASHNSEKAGYGIGLSMAESIVKLHKGKISAAYSSGVITFTVTL